MYTVIKSNDEMTVGYTKANVEIGDTATVTLHEENGNFIEVTGVVVETI